MSSFNHDAVYNGFPNLPAPIVKEAASVITEAARDSVIPFNAGEEELKLLRFLESSNMCKTREELQQANNQEIRQQEWQLQQYQLELARRHIENFRQANNGGALNMNYMNTGGDFFPNFQILQELNLFSSLIFFVLNVF